MVAKLFHDKGPYIGTSRHQKQDFHCGCMALNFPPHCHFHSSTSQFRVGRFLDHNLGWRGRRGGTPWSGSIGRWGSARKGGCMAGWSERGRRGRRGLNASEWGKRVVAIEEREMDSGRTHSNANGVSASFNTLLLMHASMRASRRR